MKKTISMLILLNFTIVNAQINEIGAYLGGSNFVGDVGKTNYVDPNEFAFGLVYKWNRSPRHSYRFSYTTSKMTANDDFAKESARKIRSLDFENRIHDFTAGLEFNFFEFNLHNLENQISPYVFTGVGYTVYDGLYYKNKTAQFDSQHAALSIPMTVGVKSRFSPQWIIAAEVSARYVYADDVDGSFPTNENLEQLKFGNINSNDWYFFSGITLTYTFGDRPCYCRER